MEIEDIQGLIIRGHGDLPAAAYFILHIEDAKKAGEWLKTIVGEITPGDKKPLDRRLQLAFTFAGLQALGLPGADSMNFRSEFVQGMNTEYRARLLGDIGDSAPDTWDWGGTGTAEVHLVLIVFAEGQGQLENLCSAYSTSFPMNGLLQIARLDSNMNPGKREHFGFRDGVSQPIIPGLKKKGKPQNTVPAGEFVLGYENAYYEFADTPEMDSSLDPMDILPLANGKKERKDLGRNGSYMVFRQLLQDVEGFWAFMQEAIGHEDQVVNTDECIYLASKMVGRWPSGAPLTLSPDKDKPELSEENDFLFYGPDKAGFSCPLGSHIRRANPRDSLQKNKPEKALKVSNRHRILRRGRNFGTPLAASFLPEDMLHKKDDGESRGLQFICFNTDISRQFEFIQHTWMNNTKFEGLYADPDPLLGIKDERHKSETHDFTIQAEPLRRKITGLKRFVHVKGGAYFFMPGIRALNYLANLNTISNV